MSRPSRIPPDLRRRDDDRPAGPGLRQQRRHGDRRRAGWRSTSTGPDFELFDYDVYALCGDGDMMEGVSSEAASLAGHLMLGNLCWIYDSNRITIEGHTDLAFSEDVAARFLAYGWNVQRVGDANDRGAAGAGDRGLSSEPTIVPTLIIVDSHIGYGAPHKQDTSAAHGEPLGEEEIRLAKRSYGWPEDAKFLVPDGVREHFQDGIGQRGRELREDWSALFASYRSKVSRSCRPASSACSSASCPRAGTRTSRFSPPTPRASPPATRPARCSTPSRHITLG